MIQLDKKFLKTPEGTAVTAGLICGVLTHLLGLVNMVHNYDSVVSQPGGFGTGLTSGRWFLEIMGLIAGKLGLSYNLPLINGLIFLVFIGVTAGFAVSALEIKNRASAAWVGMLFAVFPTVTSTLFFMFTVQYYGIAILFAVLAVWLVKKPGWGRVALAALCIGFSLGVYQAYVPITIAMFVLLLIRQTLSGELPFGKLVARGFFYCGVLALGVAVYFVANKLALMAFQVDLNGYRGIDTMGQIALADVPGLLWQAFDGFLGLPFQDYCGLAARKIQKLTYLLLAASAAVIIGIRLAQLRNGLLTAMTVVLCLLFPIAVNFIVVMCPGNWIYTMMVYGFVVVGCVPAVLFETLPEGKVKAWLEKLVLLGLALLVAGYVYYDNVNYAALYYANRQAENYANSIVVQARMTEGFEGDEEWALLGSVQDPLLNSAWSEEAYYGGNAPVQELLNSYCLSGWIDLYVGYDLPMVEEARLEELSNLEQVKAMPCWPAQGSIRIIEDTVVIKFEELSK